MSTRFRKGGVPAMVMVAAAFSAVGVGLADFVPLFNGSNLEGWSTVGGSGSFTVDQGQIVGLSASNSPNTFLVTDRQYSDFILELDFRIYDPAFNSGVQIRSHSLPSHNSGRLFGYQVEIDPSSRAWSGGIYFEGGSPDRPAGWLDDLSDNPAAQTAFVLGEWNHFRIEALGRRIATWINDVPAADYVDTDDEAFLPAGVIGLQIHSNPSQTPLEVRWRNLLIEEQSPGDFNSDNSIDLQDYLVLSANMHADLSGLGPVEAYGAGDIDGDRKIDFDDFVSFRNLFPGLPSEQTAPPIPEPPADALLAMLLSAAFTRGRRGVCEARTEIEKERWLRHE
jgi:hypothetical protein